jgi:hypothetical protein
MSSTLSSPFVSLSPSSAVDDGTTKVAEKFNWHPVLMVSAFVLFMGEAIIAYRILPFEHDTQKLIHFLLQTCAMVSSSIGLYMIVDFRQRRAHSRHSLTYINLCRCSVCALAFAVFPLTLCSPDTANDYEHFYNVSSMALSTAGLVSSCLSNSLRLWGAFFRVSDPLHHRHDRLHPLRHPVPGRYVNTHDFSQTIHLLACPHLTSLFWCKSCRVLFFT